MTSSDRLTTPAPAGLPSSWPPWWLVAVMTVLTGGDLLLLWATGAPWWVLSAAVVGLTAVVWPAADLPGDHVLAWRVLVVPMVSLLVTAAAVSTRTAAVFGPAEVVALLFALGCGTRYLTGITGILAGVLPAAAVAALPVRTLTAGTGIDDDDWGIVYVVGLLLTVVAVTTWLIARYLLRVDQRGAVAAADARTAERLAMAAELHDFVAHHVTAVIVQTQMARMLAGDDQTQLTSTLDRIETTSTQALQAMRRTVGTLRGDAPIAPSTFTPESVVDSTPGLREAIDALTGVLPDQATATVDISVDADRLDPARRDLALRVVQEGVTNICRHAPDATSVHIAIQTTPTVVSVLVTDNGTGTRSLIGNSLPSTSYGLAGLRTRARQNGGTLTADRTVDGFRLHAQIPR